MALRKLTVAEDLAEYLSGLFGMSSGDMGYDIGIRRS